MGLGVRKPAHVNPWGLRKLALLWMRAFCIHGDGNAEQVVMAPGL
jgi:hypothetical protein